VCLRESRGPNIFSKGLLEPIPCATRVNWNKFFVYFLGEVVTTLTRKVFLKQLSRMLVQTSANIPTRKSFRIDCILEAVGAFYNAY